MRSADLGLAWLAVRRCTHLGRAVRGFGLLFTHLGGTTIITPDDDGRPVLRSTVQLSGDHITQVCSDPYPDATRVIAHGLAVTRQLAELQGWTALLGNGLKSCAPLARVAGWGLGLGGILVTLVSGLLTRSELWEVAIRLLVPFLVGVLVGQVLPRTVIWYVNRKLKRLKSWAGWPDAVAGEPPS